MLQKFSTWRSTVDYQLLELLSGSSIALLMKIIGAALAFALNVVFARFLGADGAGQYYLALNAVTIAVVFGRMGLDKAVMRFVATNAETGNWTAVKGVQRNATIFAIVSASLVTLLVFALAPWIAKFLFQKSELLIPLRWSALAILPMTLNYIFVHLLKGKKRILQATIIENVTISAVALAFFVLLGHHFAVAGAAWAYIMGVSATCLMGLVFWRKSAPELRNVAARFEWRTLLNSSTPLFWVALTTWIVSYFGEFALGLWGSTADVGVFGAATRTAMLITFALMAVTSIAAPQFAALYAQGKWNALARSARNAMRVTALAAAVPTLVCIIAPGWIMSIFGADFVTGSTVLIILALAQFVNAATGPVELLLMMSGKERIVRTNVILIGILNIGLYVILTPLLGAIGAAIAFAIGLILKNLLSIWLVKRHLNIKLYGLMPAHLSAD